MRRHPNRCSVRRSAFTPLRRRVGLVRIPIIGIGGVTAARAREMRCAGAFGVAVITAILGAADVESATRELLDAVTFVS